MGKDTEIREQIEVIHAKIDQLKERLKMIPAEINTLELGRRELRAKIIELSKKMQEEGKIQESADFVEKSNLKLRGITRNVEEKLKEQAQIQAEIKNLERKRSELMF